MFVKIDGSFINLDLVHSIDVDDDGTATLWFSGANGECRDVTADDMKAIVAAIRHESVVEEIEPPTLQVQGLPDVKGGTIRDYKDDRLPGPEAGGQRVHGTEDTDSIIAAKDAEIAELKAIRKRLEEANANLEKRKDSIYNEWKALFEKSRDLFEIIRRITYAR